MKDFKHFGIKRRYFPDYNYNAIWHNLKTIRLGEGQAKELPSGESEFYDISLGNKCTTGKCKFCYVSSDPKGNYYPNISETWKKWMATFYEKKLKTLTITNKPFQIAIGSEGEPTEHPDFTKFIETIYSTNVVPNYTTNGVILASYNKPKSKWYAKANEILEYTSKYVGGVAISFGNKALRKFAKDAVKALIEKGNCHINLHHIISTIESVDEFVEIWKEYGDNIKYHVLLPLMPSGRSTSGIEEGVFEYLESKINEYDMKNIAFGAHFIEYLKKSKNIKTWLYEPESFSKNVILKENDVFITPSSFNLNPIQEIKFNEDGTYERKYF